MMDRADLAADPRIVQRAVAFWRNGFRGFWPTYHQALALILLRYDIFQGAYQDDRHSAEEQDSC